MKTKFSLTISFLFLAVIAAACGSQPGARASSAAVEDQAGLIEALRAEGATLQVGDPVEQIFFSVQGQIIQVNGEDVQVFEYETAEAMQADASQVSPDGGSIGTTMVTWVSTPHFYKAGRIIVLYVGDESAIIELLEGALGPQFAGR